MTAIWTFLAVGVSLAAVVRLSASDPKRRRVFALPPTNRPRRVRLLWCLALAPGVGLAWLGSAADVVVWCGAITTLGWSLVAVPPPVQLSMAQAVSGIFSGRSVSNPGLASIARRVGAVCESLPRLRLADPADADRIAALEARIAALEAVLSARRAGEAGVGPSLVEALQHGNRKNG